MTIAAPSQPMISMTRGAPIMSEAWLLSICAWRVRLCSELPGETHMNDRLTTIIATPDHTREGRGYRVTGWALSGLTIAFMLFDSLSKLALERHVVAATTAIGYPVAAIRPIGLILLACTILYAIPRTAVLGAVLLTGFMGGAVA